MADTRHIIDEQSEKLLQKIRNEKKLRQEDILGKIKNGSKLTEKDILDYEFTQDDVELVNTFKNILKGEITDAYKINDFLSIAQAKILIPRVIIDVARKAQDPVYLMSKFFKTVTFKGTEGLIRFPITGVLVAHDIGEGQETPSETLDWNYMERTPVSVRKSGVRVQMTEELLEQCEFDILSILISEAGRAMARLSEQKAFNEFMKHGHLVFNNALRDKYPHLGTTGVDYTNNLNDTISIEDLLDMIIAIYNNEYTPTDLLMHPLVWTVFAKNGLTGSFTSSSDREKKIEKPNSSFKLGPNSVDGRIPFAFNVNLSPFVEINKQDRTFNLICVDKDNVGYRLQKNKLATESWDDPSRDIKNIKLGESYGFATLNQGNAIAVASGISMAKSYPTPERVVLIK